MAARPDAVFETPWRLYEAGRGGEVRAGLEAALAAPNARAAAVQAPVLELLLEICRHGEDWDCVRTHAPALALAVAAAPDRASVIQARRTATAAYYLELARWSEGRAPAALLKARAAGEENAADGDLYLRRQLLTARLRLASGERQGFDDAMARALSLVATLDAPQDGRRTVAYGLVEALGLLVEAGERERAYGLYRAAGPQLGAALGSDGYDAALYRLTTARVLAQMGDGPGAAAALDAALPLLRQVQMPGEDRTRRLAQALTLRAALAVAAGDAEAAGASLAAHPYARAPAQADEDQAAYLAVRLLAARASGVADADAVAAAARMEASTGAGRAAIYRAAVRALATPAGRGRSQAAARLAGLLRREAAAPGPWSHPGIVERLLIGVALEDGGADLPPDLAFELFQLAGRSGPSQDADAVALLGRAADEAQRRTAHQVLRLEARRDQLVREQVQKVARRLADAPTDALALGHSVADRQRIADFDRRIADGRARLSAGGLKPNAGGLVGLAAFQKALGPGEAALAVAPSVDGRAYLCIRREAVMRVAAPADEARLKLDGRLLQQALSAGHAPSEALDSQYPAAAAVRLYDGLLRPLESCFSAADTLLWLGAPAGAPPLAALLPAVPPRRGDGFDLAAADWVVRRHAVAYAGSAAALLAGRTGVAPAAADFDFLGVGDPVLAGPHAGASDTLAVLPPLPETRPELEASARPFKTNRLLLGSGATERGLRRELVGHYRLLSFATHGLMRDDLQGLAEPALVLTPVRADDPWDDGLLTAAEIADLDLRASFVALSACNTANADPQTLAEDLPALTSAFAVAGAPSVLATLWPVDSETGRRVVAGTFERVGASGAGPASALAEAQRAFLAAPPSRAHLHPRFWAPFVLVGEGGRPLPGERVGPRVVSATPLTAGSGEAVALQPVDPDLVASLIDEPDAAGSHGAGLLRVSPAGAEAWRTRDSGQGATRVLLPLGGQLLSAGYAPAAGGRYGPVLALSASADGAALGRWQGQGAGGRDAFPMAGAALGPEAAVVAVAQLNLRGAGGAPDVLQVLRVDAALAPRPLFEVAAPAGARILGSTTTLTGGRLLVSVSYAAAQASRAEGGADDYDAAACGGARATRLELRGLDGALLAQSVLTDVVVSAATAVGDQVWLGGARQAPCALDAQAEVLALDGAIKPRPVWRDETLGASDVRAMHRAEGGGAWIAASKASVVDFRPVGEALARRPDPYALRPTGAAHAALLVRLMPNGPAAPPKLIEAGSDVLVDALIQPSDAALALAGAVGGRAALVRMETGAGR